MLRQGEQVPELNKSTNLLVAESSEYSYKIAGIAGIDLFNGNMLAAVKQQGLAHSRATTYIILQEPRPEFGVEAESAAACNGCITAGEGPAARGHADQR